MAKKSFKTAMQEKAVNPTMQFISQPDEFGTNSVQLRQDLQEEKISPAHRAMPQYNEETKSRRLQLLLTPSLYEAIKEKASQERVSVNELINMILSESVRK